MPSRAIGSSWWSDDEITGFWARLLRNASGNAVIETAVFMPFVLLLLAGLADFSQAVAQRLLAQQAVAKALELASNADAGVVNEALLRSEAARAAGVPETSVSASVWLECDGVAQPSTTSTCNSGAVSARYASVTIQRPYELLLYSRLVDALPNGGDTRFQVQGSVRFQ